MGLLKFIAKAAAKEPLKTNSKTVNRFATNSTNSKNSTKPKNQRVVETITTTLNGNTAKGRQELLQCLKTRHEPLKVVSVLRGGTLSLYVSTESRSDVGTIPSRIVDNLFSKYNAPNGLNCDITIGTDYIIESKDNKLVCKVKLKISK